MSTLRACVVLLASGCAGAEGIGPAEECAEPVEASTDPAGSMFEAPLAEDLGFRQLCPREECTEPAVGLTREGALFGYDIPDQSYSWTAMGPVSWFDRDVYGIDFLQASTGRLHEVRMFFTCDSSGAMRIVGTESYSSSYPAPRESTQELYDPPPRWLPEDLDVGFGWTDRATVTEARLVLPQPVSVTAREVSIEGSVVGTEVLTTPAGTFAAVNVTGWREGAWADGVGPVRDGELLLETFAP